MEHAKVEVSFLNKIHLTLLPQRDLNLPDFVDYELPFNRYIADKSSVNASALKKIYDSPFEFLQNWLSLSDEIDEESEAEHFRFGRAMHMMLLEPKKFKKLYVVMPEFTGYTQEGKESTKSKEAKIKREEWKADQDANALIITEKELDKMENMFQAIMIHPKARNFFGNGRPEVTLYWNCPLTGIRCKGRIDYLSFDGDGDYYIIDYKTTQNSKKGPFAEAIGRYKYFVSMAHYEIGATQVFKKPPAGVLYLAGEKANAYTVRSYNLPDSDLEAGRRWQRHGMSYLLKSLKTGKWPDQTEIEDINVPKKYIDEPLPWFDYGDEDGDT